MTDYWKNPYEEHDGQVHSNKKVPEQSVEGNILWRLDSENNVSYWIAESSGEFVWKNDHKNRLASLDSENYTPGWSFRTQTDSEWTPLVLGTKFVLPRTKGRHFRPESDGASFLLFKATVIPQVIPTNSDGKIFGFKVQE